MHPELIGALARDRHAELLRAQQFRNRSRGGSPSLEPRRFTPVLHLRRALGAALVSVGTRLLPRNPTAGDWVVQASRRSTVP